MKKIYKIALCVLCAHASSALAVKQKQNEEKNEAPTIKQMEREQEAKKTQKKKKGALKTKLQELQKMKEEQERLSFGPHAPYQDGTSDAKINQSNNMSMFSGQEQDSRISVEEIINRPKTRQELDNELQQVSTNLREHVWQLYEARKELQEKDEALKQMTQKLQEKDGALNQAREALRQEREDTAKALKEKEELRQKLQQKDEELRQELKKKDEALQQKDGELQQWAQQPAQEQQWAQQPAQEKQWGLWKYVMDRIPGFTRP